MKYRKKPIIVEAEQWFPDKKLDSVIIDPPTRPYVISIHGQATFISPGDWIITEPDGEHHYPCKPDIFEATYEPVKEDKDGQVSGRECI